VGRVKNPRAMVGSLLPTDTVYGAKAQEYRGLLKIRYPMEHGIVDNWADMEKLWDHVYKEELKAPSEEVRTQTHRETSAHRQKE
jgi:centractin